MEKPKMSAIDRIVYEIHQLLDKEKEREIEAVIKKNAESLDKKVPAPSVVRTPFKKAVPAELSPKDALMANLLKVKLRRAAEQRRARVTPADILATVERPAEPVVQAGPASGNASENKSVPSELLGIGLDVGTSNLVASRMTEAGPEMLINRNAFLSIRDDDVTKDILARLEIPKQIIGGKSCVIGKDAFEFSNFFDRVAQRSMNIGVINPFEREAIHVLNMLVEKMLWQPRVPDEICSFSMPAQPVDNNIDVLYHKNVVETMLSCLGYEPLAVNEGYAVVLSELKDQKFTGIGISCGGGMVNVCITYTAIVIAEFSIARGGDWIDLFASKALDISPSKCAAIKEKGMSILRPEDREQESIAIYYKQYIRYFLEQMARILQMPAKGAHFDQPVDIVFAGGSSMVGGFIEVVRRELKTIDLGIPINEVRLAKDPFTSVSRGCLFNAQMASQQGGGE